MKTFTFVFDELPLAIINGIETALVTGRVEIEYSADADWQLVGDSIELEGSKHLTWKERDAGVKPWVYVPATPELATIIAGRLQREWRDKVFSAVTDQIEVDREEAAEYRAEQRMERV